MNFLERIWNNIISSNDQEFYDKIDELENEVEGLEESLTSLELTTESHEQELIELDVQYEDLLGLYNSTVEELLIYKHNPTPYTIPIDIIDTTKFGYLPNTLIYYYSNNKIETKSVPVTVSKFYRMWSDEMYVYFRNAVKNCKTFDEKVVKLRDAVKNIVTYKLDVTKNGTMGENWRFPLETFYGGIGDCEDTTSLWVTACNICNLPADRIFNITGFYKPFNKDMGHSFGGAKFDNGKWYIIETTAKKAPIEMIGSDYRVPLNNLINGLSNWAMSGKSKKEQF